MFDLSSVQSALQSEHLDGWLLYDFRGLNVLARRVVQFPADVLWERGRRLYQAHGRLLLNDWAAECAVPGLTDLPDAGDLRKVLARTGESVGRLVAAAFNPKSTFSPCRLMSSGL